MRDLAGKSIVLTGAGAGIGRAMAVRFCAEGAQVLGIDRAAEGLARTASLCTPGFEAMVADVTDPALPGLITAHLAETGRDWDVLVNNAGVGGGGMAEDCDDDELERFLSINVKALFRLSRAAVKAMQGRGGVILNLASIYSFVGATASAGYSTSKAAVAGLTRQMATDYGPEGIRVVALAPGLIETPLTAERIRTEAWRRQIFIDQAPLRRVGQPEDIAAAASFLISEDAAFITGETLRVDGGWSLGRYPRPGSAA